MYTVSMYGHWSVYVYFIYDIFAESLNLVGLPLITGNIKI